MAPLPADLAISSAPADPYVGAMARADDAEATGDLSTAVTALMPILDSYPQDYALPLRLGWLSLRMKRASKAERFFRIAGARAPAAPEPRLGLARVFVFRDLCSGSMTDMARVALRAPQPAAGITNTQPTADGSQVFQQSYDLEAQGRIECALEALDGIPPTQKESYLASFRRGLLLYRLGRHEEAVASYAKASAAQPASIEAKIGRLAPLIALRRWNDTEAGARDVLRQDPHNYSANIRLAFALYNQGRYAEAETVYRSLSAAYPSKAEVRAGLGWSLLKLRRTAAAAATFSEVLFLAPRDPPALDGSEPWHRD